MEPIEPEPEREELSRQSSPRTPAAPDPEPDEPLLVGGWHQDREASVRFLDGWHEDLQTRDFWQAER